VELRKEIAKIATEARDAEKNFLATDTRIGDEGPGSYEGVGTLK